LAVRPTDPHHSDRARARPRRGLREYRPDVGVDRSSLRRGSRAVRRRRPDDGTAPIEFIVGTTVLLLPLIFLIVSLAQVQAGLYAAQPSAIDAARTAARHPADAQATAQTIAQLHFADHDLEDAEWDIDLHCARSCTMAGAPVTATVTARIPIPGIPAIL